MKKILLLASCLLAVSAFAQETTVTTTTTEKEEPTVSPGGLFIEPILGVSRSATEIKSSQLPLITDDTSGGLNTAQFGMRLGVHISEVVFGGIDARYARAAFGDSAYGSADGDMYNWAPTIGVQMPIAGLRIWGAYVLGGQFDPDSGSQGFNARFSDPNGLRVGVGVHIMAVSLNLEYQNLTYNNTDVQSFGTLPINQASNVDFTDEGLAVSLSFPVEL